MVSFIVLVKLSNSDSCLFILVNCFLWVRRNSSVLFTFFGLEVVSSLWSLLWANRLWCSFCFSSSVLGTGFPWRILYCFFLASNLSSIILSFIFSCSIFFVTNWISFWINFISPVSYLFFTGPFDPILSSYSTSSSLENASYITILFILSLYFNN